jgi:hypothetical protein
MVKKQTPPPIAADGLLHLNLDNLIPWEDNYNQGDIGAIALSIRRFGFNNLPRVWNGLHLRAGNHSTLALRQIKAEGARPDLDRAFPPHNVTVSDGAWFIHCLNIGDLTESEATAFAIADNRAAALASQDETVLLKHLSAIYDADMALLAATGYDGEDLEALRKQLGQPIVAEDFNLTPKEALDVYLNGAVKQIVLYFDSATYLDTVERLTKVMMENNLDSNTSTVIHLLEQYEQQKGLTGDADPLFDDEAAGLETF